MQNSSKLKKLLTCMTCVQTDSMGRCTSESIRRRDNTFFHYSDTILYDVSYGAKQTNRTPASLTYRSSKKLCSSGLAGVSPRRKISLQRYARASGRNN